ncbi:hypothetical protein BKA62DRAFT_626217 [Auriculariales sp. MPI-PUGE-AT-0066]|nr:hypothetical protein BKA62DRAFT_626217 [Auriculariales sp. MPI-PUGE-AT-0066]
MDAAVSKSCTTFPSSLLSTAGTSTPCKGEQESLFAVFRPGLSMAASGSTLAAMHKEWRARWPGEDEEVSAEDLRRKPFACPYCRRRFDRPSIRQTHINSHTGDRPHQCKFLGCTKTFSVLSNKYRHERSHEGPMKLQATVNSFSKNSL